MVLQLVRQKVRNIYRDGAIKTGVRYAGGMVVVRDSLDGKVGDAPQSKKIRAYFCM
jgi:hypothetical protein